MEYDHDLRRATEHATRWEATSEWKWSEPFRELIIKSITRELQQLQASKSLHKEEKIDDKSESQRNTTSQPTLIPSQLAITAAGDSLEEQEWTRLALQWIRCRINHSNQERQELEDHALKLLQLQRALRSSIGPQLRDKHKSLGFLRKTHEIEQMIPEDLEELLSTSHGKAIHPRLPNFSLTQTMHAQIERVMLRQETTQASRQSAIEPNKESLAIDAKLDNPPQEISQPAIQISRPAARSAAVPPPITPETVTTDDMDFIYENYRPARRVNRSRSDRSSQPTVQASTVKLIDLAPDITRLLNDDQSTADPQEQKASTTSVNPRKQITPRQSAPAPEIKPARADQNSTNQQLQRVITQLRERRSLEEINQQLSDLRIDLPGGDITHLLDTSPGQVQMLELEEAAALLIEAWKKEDELRAWEKTIMTEPEVSGDRVSDESPEKLYRQEFSSRKEREHYLQQAMGNREFIAVNEIRERFNISHGQLLRDISATRSFHITADGKQIRHNRRKNR